MTGHSMRRTLAALTFVAAALTGAAATAQTNPVVVELYTSQGCSSCPPADDMMHDLAARSDVIALALHVDYWDYIGWADSFADPAYTRRQQQYARVANHRTIYTPQMIIGGQDHIVGAKPMEVADLIRDHMAAPSGVSVQISRSGDQLTISAEANRAPRGDLLVQLVRYTPSARVDIRRGENAGKTIDYANIVQAWDVIGRWNGRAPLQMQTAVRGDMPIVVILQEQGPGRVLAAAELK